MKRKILSVVMLLVFCGALLTGCGSMTKNSANSSEKQYKIGFSQCTLSSPFYTEMKTAAEEYANEHGIELVFLNADNDVQKQNNDVLNLISGKIDALIINPVNSEGVSIAMQAASDANIPIITVDRFTDDEHVTARVIRDNKYMGQIVGEQLLKELGKDNEGVILEIQGASGDSVMMERRDGFEKVFENTKYKIVKSTYCDYSRSKAIAATQNLFQGNTDIVAVYGHNDDMALGALQACNDSGIKNVKVCGIDGISEAVQAIANGNGYCATALNDPRSLLETAMHTCEDVLNGKSVEKEINAGTDLIYSENAVNYADTLKESSNFAVFEAN